MDGLNLVYVALCCESLSGRARLRRAVCSWESTRGRLRRGRGGAKSGLEGSWGKGDTRIRNQKARGERGIRDVIGNARMPSASPGYSTLTGLRAVKPFYPSISYRHPSPPHEYQTILPTSNGITVGEITGSIPKHSPKKSAFPASLDQSNDKPRP